MTLVISAVTDLVDGLGLGPGTGDDGPGTGDDGGGPGPGSGTTTGAAATPGTKAPVLSRKVFSDNNHGLFCFFPSQLHHL